MLNYLWKYASRLLHSREELYASLKKLVKCEGCNEEIRTAAGVCQVGHAVCLDCGNGHRCPICTEPHLSKRFAMMNRIIEALEDQEHFLETISEQLECPICYEDVSMAGWRNCIQGHAVCLSCSEKTFCCSLCRSAYSAFQCTALVQMLEELKKRVKCKYHHNGCKEAFLIGKQLFNHEKICECTDATCMVKGCSWVGARNKLSHHFKQNHQGLITDGKLDLIFGTDGVYMIRAGKNSYFLTYTYNHEGIQLKYLNSEARPDYYTWSLEIQNQGTVLWRHVLPSTSNPDGVQNYEMFLPLNAIENRGQTSGVRTFKLGFQEQKMSYMAMMHYAIGAACILGGCYSLVKSHV